jgi:hypothetical protein
MLKIVDLNRNEELPSSNMGKVAGGMSYGTALEIVQSVLQQTSDSASGSGSGSGGAVSENVSFSFASIKWGYTQQ